MIPIVMTSGTFGRFKLSLHLHVWFLIWSFGAEWVASKNITTYCIVVFLQRISVQSGLTHYWMPCSVGAICYCMFMRFARLCCFQRVSLFYLWLRAFPIYTKYVYVRYAPTCARLCGPSSRPHCPFSNHRLFFAFENPISGMRVSFLDSSCWDELIDRPLGCGFYNIPPKQGFFIYGKPLKPNNPSWWCWYIL